MKPNVNVKEVKVREGYKILGFSLPVFGLISAIILSATYLKVLPAGMIGAFALMMIIGVVFGEIGDKLPIVNTFLGGGPIVIIFASAALVAYKVLPEYSIKIMDDFMKGGGFLDFYIAALITGSILGMNRKLLIKATVRYLPAIIGATATALGLVALVGALIGYGGKQALLFIGIPIMGGGMGAGAVPLSKIFGSSTGADPEIMLSMMVPAVALGNALSIVMAGVLDKIGKAIPSITGNGNLMAVEGEAVTEETIKEEVSYKSMATGILLSLTFYTLGTIINKYVPDIHSYAWMIISVAVVKALGILPRKYELCAFQWFEFVMTSFTGVLLVGIGVAYTNLNHVIKAITPQYVTLVFTTVFGAIIGGGLVGKLVGFYPIESSITAGLCMSNMGGTGDVAVLSAAKRMKLMPFAQISSRIGGALILLLASALIKLLV